MSHKFVSNGSQSSTKTVRIWCEKCGYMLYDGAGHHYEEPTSVCPADDVEPEVVPLIFNSPTDCDHVYAGATGGDYCIRCGKRQSEADQGCTHSYSAAKEGWKCILCGKLLRPPADE